METHLDQTHLARDSKCIDLQSSLINTTAFTCKQWNIAGNWKNTGVYQFVSNQKITNVESGFQTAAEAADGSSIAHCDNQQKRPCCSVNVAIASLSEKKNKYTAERLKYSQPDFSIVYVIHVWII